MALQGELETYVQKVFAESWSVTDGRVVPSTTDIGLGNVGRKLDATVIYADLAESTGLVASKRPEFAAEVYKSYLYCASKVITSLGGSITAFDGDRVMGVFLGDDKNTKAAKCALQINWTVREIIQPALKAVYKTSTYTVKQKVGVDSSELLVVRAGIRGSNDLIWVGTAANNAAKMAALDKGYSSYISAAVYGMLNDTSKYGGTPKRDMWTRIPVSSLGYTVYGSTFWWSL
ncbi:adenylate/guanylate cyclase domain-containing protein [Cellulomonas biazotea]|uniref:Guanylate cyclase n=1 Tax=Cellulomonas biazotea TaxID=1709 RepID=A0A402DU23_9CELL|nr:adenylate/guanylate cyclase domain-containing protein [Cellulomonas biazotea]GCE77576.1 guanylate cyclase [Cellulomonas biazotea]